MLRLKLKSLECCEILGEVLHHGQIMRLNFLSSDFLKCRCYIAITVSPLITRWRTSEMIA
jgi:hypothetical protein